MKLSRVATLADERLLKHIGEASQPLRLSGLGLQLHTEGMPIWWSERGNAYYGKSPLPEGVLQLHPTLPPPTNCALILGRDVTAPGIIHFSGDEGILVISPNCRLGDAEMSCGHQSTIIIGERVLSKGSAFLSADNGGLIKIGALGIWSVGVRILANDEYRMVETKSGKIFADSGCVFLDEKVALGHQVILLPGSDIGRGSIVGARAVVNGAIPANTMYWGAPAPLILEGVSWSLTKGSSD